MPTPEPPAPKTTEMPPVPITMIGTGPGTDLAGKTATTPKGSPNLLITSVVTPLMAVFVRFAHLYGITLIGLVTAGLTPLAGNLIPYTDFMTLLYGSALAAIPGPMLGVLKDVVTIFARLEGKFPLLTGNI